MGKQRRGGQRDTRLKRRHEPGRGAVGLPMGVRLDQQTNDVKKEISSGLQESSAGREYRSDVTWIPSYDKKRGEGRGGGRIAQKPLKTSNQSFSSYAKGGGTESKQEGMASQVSSKKETRTGGERARRRMTRLAAKRSWKKPEEGLSSGQNATPRRESKERKRGEA